MNILALSVVAMPFGLLLGFLLPSRSRIFVLLGMAAAVGLWILIVVSVASGDSTGSGESWSLGEYAALGGLSLAVFAAIWSICVRGGRWLRLRFGPSPGT
jgi:hypothetical protein